MMRIKEKNVIGCVLCASIQLKLLLYVLQRCVVLFVVIILNLLFFNLLIRF